MEKKMRLKPALLGLSFVYFYSIAASQEVENLNVELDRILHHDLKVFLDPESRQISVEDVITLPENLVKNVILECWSIFWSDFVFVGPGEVGIV